MGPWAQSDGHDAPWLLDELVSMLHLALEPRRFHAYKKNPARRTSDD